MNKAGGDFMKWKDSFHPYALITIVFWSLAYVLTRLALQNFSAFSLGFLRYFIAACTILVLSPFIKIERPQRTDWKWFLAAGAAGFFFYMVAFNKGCKTVTAATSSVVVATVPVITALLARVIYQERLRFCQWGGMALSFTGVVLLTLLDGLFTINTGLVWLLLAAVALSSYNLLQRKLTQTYSALQTAAFSILAGTLLLGIFLPAAVEEVKQAPPLPLVYVAILGIFPSAIAYVAWSQALAKAKTTSSVSNYMFVTPFLTSLLGFFIAGETPDLPTIVGGALVLIGILIFHFGGNADARLPHTKSAP